MNDTVRHNPPQAEWQGRALETSDGTGTGAILRAALAVPIKRTPRFGFKAIVTTDGFIMADFTDSMGVKHMHAFVGAVSDVVENFKALADHLSLTDEERQAMYRVVSGWIARDYRRENNRPADLFTTEEK